jgi:aldehyde dehydrogenase (NAD+)
VKAAEASLEDGWGAISPAERGRLLRRLAQSVQDNRQELAQLETLDMGKPFRDALGDVDGAVQTLEYNAGAADKLQGDTIPLELEYVDFTWLEPLGVTAHIVPWNFPLGMAIRSIAPALAAGCSVVLKPAEQSPLSALRLAAIAENSGIPEGVFNVVTGFGPEAGAALVRHPGVRGITFTGSVETGRQIMAQAATGLKPLVLELGGKNPMIIFPDADLERAVGDALDGIFGNCGQVCSAVSRIVVHKQIKKDFLACLSEAAKKLSIGPGMENPDLGPLVSREQFEKVMRYIDVGIHEGANLLCGGHRPEHMQKGYFIEPTIFDGVKPPMHIAQEEIFGPVAATLEFDEEDEAVEIANGVSYGLVAGVYTQDISRAFRMARKIKAGSVWINGWYIGGVQAPTGGTKESGFGRERGLAGIHNYLQIKNIGIKL